MSHYQPLLTIIGTIAAGIFSLILANKARLPSILFFLTSGILLGPSFANLIQPGVFSTNFPQYISILVALILFEGGMSLKTSQLKEISRPLRGLLTLGVMVTIVLISVFTHFLTQMSWSKSILFGAVMVVTGPTVVIPILHRVRVKENLHNILKWESILIDSIGVILAVVLFEILVSHGGGLGEALLMFIGRFCLGGFLGLLCGFLMVTALRDKKLLLLEGDELGGLFVLSMVLLFFGLSEMILPESGLVSATVAGLYFGNQKFPQKEEISRFKQQITLFALSGLFILLSANVPVGKIKTVYFEGSLLLCFMIFVVRPISVFLSTQGDSRLQFKDKFFLSFMAPRGIVSASLASLFAIQFEERALTGRGVFLPLAFFVITGSIVFYAFLPSVLFG
ncbi:MAG: sodium:proton antiporter, partial [Candidatus Omnitrophica bacterium]|nr:sodium:proton antiporter [Candidatus Omnitrophota bacterium]